MKLSALILNLFILVLTQHPVTAQQTTLISHLPIVTIQTNGNTIQDTQRIAVKFGIIYNGLHKENKSSDTSNHFNGLANIEYRGSTSQQYPKKSYSFETQGNDSTELNVSFLGLPEENDWILYGAYQDKSLLRNELTYTLANALGHYAPRTRYCELLINNEYKGVYTLIEKIKRDKNRVSIASLSDTDLKGDSLTGGYIVKIDKSTQAGVSWPSEYSDRIRWEISYPNQNQLHPLQKGYIINYIKELEAMLMNQTFIDTGGYKQWIDVPSFVDFIILQELGRSPDAYRSSCYFYKDKDSKGGKLKAGPVWDFNMAYGNSALCQSFKTAGFQYDFNELCGSYYSIVPAWWKKIAEEPTFHEALSCRYKRLRQSVLSEESLFKRIDSLQTNLGLSIERNFNRWPILDTLLFGVLPNHLSYTEEIDYLKYWLTQRLNWLDTQWKSDCVVGLKEQENSTSFYLYPNPGNSQITLVCPKGIQQAELLLTDLSGKVLHRQSLYSLERCELNTEKLANGIYFITLIQANGHSKTHKWVKQN